MSERRFYIAVNDGLPTYITESELKRRLEVFSDEAYWRHEGVDNIIDILLHGEGKEEPRIKDQLVRLNGTDNPEPVYPDPWKAFEKELHKRYKQCPINTSADSILLAVLNAVASVMKMPRGK